MAPIAQRLNDMMPYHDHWQDDSHSVSSPWLRPQLNITKHLESLFRTIYTHDEGLKHPFEYIRHETGDVQDSTHINGVHEPGGLIYT